MFYEGDLQSGISAAVQQSKLVTCFVRDDEAESMIWEEEYLKDATLSKLLLEKTLLLRLQAGSQESGFLAAIYPIPKTPSLVIIHNGQLQDHLTTGISKLEFFNRVKIALNGSPTTAEGISTPQLEHDSDSVIASTSTRNQVPIEGQQSHRVREMLEERSTRLEIKKKKQDDAEKAERAAKAKARKEALETPVTNPENSTNVADMKYALMQKKRQQEARSERARILQRVEDDKAERRAKEAFRKEQANAIIKSSIDMQPLPLIHPISSALRKPVNDQEGDCALQVRLFDGSTIKSRFPIQNTLRGEVRRWIDSQIADKDMPYTFKQVMTPHPVKTITVSEEEESLRSLGFDPSATLILVPVKDYASAYEGGATSYIAKGVSTGAGLVSSSINLIAGTLSSFLGGSTTPGVNVAAERDPSLAPPSFGALMEQQRNSDEHQLYNGNALNFEPRIARRDEDDRED